jgi:hypothetical protein
MLLLIMVNLDLRDLLDLRERMGLPEEPQVILDLQVQPDLLEILVQLDLQVLQQTQVRPVILGLQGIQGLRV